MDRIDLYADVQEVDHAALLTNNNQTDDAVRRRILHARQQQAARFSSTTKLNATMTNRDIKTKSGITLPAKSMLDQAAKTLDLSARSYMRVIKVARTIADLNNASRVTTEHIAEALQYRNQTFRAI